MESVSYLPWLNQPFGCLGILKQQLACFSIELGPVQSVQDIFTIRNLLVTHTKKSCFEKSPLASVRSCHYNVHKTYVQKTLCKKDWRTKFLFLSVPHFLASMSIPHLIPVVLNHECMLQWNREHYTISLNPFASGIQKVLLSPITGLFSVKIREKFLAIKNFSVNDTMSGQPNKRLIHWHFEN